MFIDAKELNAALGRVGAIASLDKTQPGILFDIQEDSVSIYYNSQGKAIINTIPAVVDAEEIHGKVVFDYKKLIDTISYCKGSGRIQVDNIEFQLTRHTEQSGTAKVNVIKYMVMAERTETGDVEDVRSVVSTNTYDISWWDANNLPIKQKILNNPACDNMFNEADSSIWDTSALASVLSDTCTGDSKVVYMSPKYNGCFAINTNSTVYVRAQNVVNKIIQLQTSAAKAIISVLNSLETDTVHLNTINSDDGKLFACIIFTEDGKLSVYMGAAAMSQPHLISMGRYTGFGYKTYQANILTDVLKDTLKSAVNLNAAPNGVISFVKDTDTGEVNAIVTASDTGASVNNTYRMKCKTFNTLLADPENTDEIFHLNIDLKLVHDIVNTNKFDYTGLDIEAEGDKVFLRISFLDLEAAKSAREVYKKDHNIDGALSMADKLELRSEYVATCYYVTVKNG